MYRCGKHNITQESCLLSQVETIAQIDILQTQVRSIVDVDIATIAINSVSTRSISEWITNKVPTLQQSAIFVRRTATIHCTELHYIVHTTSEAVCEEYAQRKVLVDVECIVETSVDDRVCRTEIDTVLIVQ